MKQLSLEQKAEKDMRILRWNLYGQKLWGKKKENRLLGNEAMMGAWSELQKLAKGSAVLGRE